jgi:hypothetical protein
MRQTTADRHDPRGGVELDDVLRYTGIHDRRGPQRSGLFGADPANGAILLPEMSMPDVQYVR